MDGRKVALDIARDHFGKAAAVIVDCLLARPNQTLRSIISATSLPSRNTRTILTSLIHHNIAEWGEKGDVVVYRILEGVLLTRIRFPWYNLYAKNLFKDDVPYLLCVFVDFF